jgi:hypothetical protein
MSSMTIDDYKLLIKHLTNLTKINNDLPLFYYIDNLDMIILKIKSCMFESPKSIQILQNTNPLFLNFYDVIYELKQSIIYNSKLFDSIYKYKIEISMDYSNFINLDNTYSNYKINKKNYKDMIREVREIVKIVINKCSGSPMPYQLRYMDDL